MFKWCKESLTMLFTLLRKAPAEGTDAAAASVVEDPGLDIIAGAATSNCLALHENVLCTILKGTAFKVVPKRLGGEEMSDTEAMYFIKPLSELTVSEHGGKDAQTRCVLGNEIVQMSFDLLSAELEEAVLVFVEVEIDPNKPGLRSKPNSIPLIATVKEWEVIKFHLHWFAFWSNLIQPVLWL